MVTLGFRGPAGWPLWFPLSDRQAGVDTYCAALKEKS